MNKFFVIVLFIAPLFLISQEFKKKDFSANRKRQLFFKVGSEFRVTPVPYGNRVPDPATSFTNVDQLHAGPAFSYGLEFFTSENFSIGLDHSFRYDTVLYDFNQTGENFVALKSEKELLQGFHLYLTKYFKIFKEGEIFVRFGISSFNGGSEFFLVEPIGDDGEGNPLLFTQTQRTFANFGPNLAIGYNKNRVSMIGGVYLQSGGTFYTTSFPIIVPYLKLTYNIGKL